MHLGQGVYNALSGADSVGEDGSAAPGSGCDDRSRPVEGYIGYT